jgi:hypothetical protein
MGDPCLSFDPCLVLAGAQQNTHRRIVTICHHIIPIPAYIGIQLADVLMVELFKFKLNQNMAFEYSMVKDEIYTKMLVADQYAFLACLETKAVAELQ